MRIYRLEVDIDKALKTIKEWLPQRRWLIKNKIVFETYPEEIEFKNLCNEFRLLQKAQFGRMSKSMMKVAKAEAAKEIERRMFQNAMIRARKDFLAK